MEKKAGEFFTFYGKSCWEGFPPAWGKETQELIGLNEIIRLDFSHPVRPSPVGFFTQTKHAPGYLKKRNNEGFALASFSWDFSDEDAKGIAFTYGKETPWNICLR